MRHSLSNIAISKGMGIVVFIKVNSESPESPPWSPLGVSKLVEMKRNHEKALW